MTKSKLIQILADRQNLPRPQVNLLLENLVDVVTETLKTEGTCVIPDLVKFTLKDKPATPERDGVNPFTKEPIKIPAKPASKKVHVSPVVALKRAIVGDA